MTPPGAAVAADRWLSFLEEYKRRVPADPLGIVAYQLFADIRDAGPELWVKEPFKALHFSWLSSAGTDLERLSLEPYYDYCFIIDGSGAPGLSTSYPVVRALPSGRRALLVARDHVLRDPRSKSFLQSPSYGVVNIDRTRTPARRFSRAPREIYEVVRAFPRGLAGAPKLVHRKIHFGHVLEALLRRTSVGCLVVSNERLIMSCSAIYAAKRHGIPTACLQHGALVDQYLPVTVDTYLTWGRHANSWFRARSVSARLCDIGAPRVDHVAKYRAKPGAENESTSPPGERVVAFFSQRPGVDLPSSYYYRVEEELLTLLDGTRYVLWVKVHPADDPSRWERLARRNPGRLRLLEAGHDPYRVIAEADYVGAFFSTVLLEAMLFDKPVFQLNPFGDTVPDYSRGGGCSHVSDGDALREWVRRCDAELSFREAGLSRQRDFVREYFSNVGEASASFYTCMNPVVDARACPGRP